MSGIVKSNVNIIRDQIEAKVNTDTPFFATQNAVPLTVTDMDTFPYPRYYRGIHQIEEPVVFEREAGWRTHNDECYKPIDYTPVTHVEYCWQTPCSTVFPCKKFNGSAAKAIAQEYDCVNISR